MAPIEDNDFKYSRIKLGKEQLRGSEEFLEKHALNHINELPLKELTESIDLKIKLKVKLGDIDKIEYVDLREDMNPELFIKIIEAVSVSMSKNIQEGI